MPPMGQNPPSPQGPAKDNAWPLSLTPATTSAPADLFQVRHDPIETDFSVRRAQKTLLVFQHGIIDPAHYAQKGRRVGLITFGAAFKIMPTDTGRTCGEKACFRISVELPIGPTPGV